MPSKDGIKLESDVADALLAADALNSTSPKAAAAAAAAAAAKRARVSPRATQAIQTARPPQPAEQAPPGQQPVQPVQPFQSAQPPQPALPAHGYEPVAHQDVAQALANAEQYIHPDLRAPNATAAPTANMMPVNAPQQPHLPHLPQVSLVAVSQHPMSSSPLTGAPMADASALMAVATAPVSAPHPGEIVGTSPPPDLSSEGRKAKRELSQSKRAAQNRAAQRAFRQRKDAYIKKLEAQVQDYERLENDFKNLQMENFALREYLISMQNRMVEAGVDLPPSPPNVNLHGPPPPGPGAEDATMTEAPMDPSAPEETPMDPVAQAVAGLAHENLTDRPEAVEVMVADGGTYSQSFETQQSHIPRDDLPN